METLPITVQLIILVLLLGVNGFFSAAEVALVSVRKTRIHALSRSGVQRADLVLALIRDPDRMISATQLGVTLASLGLGWAGENTAFRILEPLFQYMNLPLNEPFGHFLSFGLAFSIITFSHMVVGEVVPKNLAMERSERLALAVAAPLQLFSRITSLFVSSVENTAAFVSRRLGLKMDSVDQGYTAEELKLLFSMSKREGRLVKLQERLLSRAVDFHDVTVREVMVPRQEMITLPRDASLDHVLDCIVRHRHSRIPVYEDSPEHVIGVLYAKQVWSFVQQMRRWSMLGRPEPIFRMASFVHTIPFVPETKLLYELLEEFQKERYHLAIVVDEFGTVGGLVTVEDALEQIVGEIREEHERHVPQEEHVLGEPVELNGNTTIRDLDSLYGVALPYNAGFETLAGFLLRRLGCIPSGGERVEFEDYSFVVTGMERNRIAKVRVEHTATIQIVDDKPERSSSV
tara:strand:- start:803 stop:2182 length:1380 start_codon:yes stop_codon:yes gene_type:complete